MKGKCLAHARMENQSLINESKFQSFFGGGRGGSHTKAE